MHNKFYRKLVVMILIIIIPTILVGGIIISDNNTRDLGFRDHNPIFYITEVESGIKFNIFGEYTHFTEEDIENFRENVKAAEIFAPRFVRLVLGVLRGAGNF